jgi:predicted nucleotidyltransferase
MNFVQIAIYNGEMMKSGRRTTYMPRVIQTLLEQYTEGLLRIYGSHLKSVILYGSYARGDFTTDSDIDIMILLDLTDMEIKEYRHQLSELTYDFNMEHDLDIKPIAKNLAHFQKWLKAYPFYSNVDREGVKIFGAA